MDVVLKKSLEAILREAAIRVYSADGGFGIYEKQGVGNYVTDLDMAVQDFLYERLTKLVPNAKFMGEEKDMLADPSKGLCFIVDPIDGTTNFIRGLGMSSISVGLTEDGKQRFGMLYQPFTDTVYWACEGEGAYRNDTRLRVSERPFPKAIIEMGASAHCRGEVSERAFRIMRSFFLHGEDLRSYGVSSLELCNVACGHCDVFAEMELCPWDYAAGSLIVAEAGGVCTRMDGTPLTFDRPQSMLSSSKACYAEALNLIRESEIHHAPNGSNQGGM